MSFTAGALLARETIVVAELAGQTPDWGRIKAQVLAENALQMRTASAGERIFREVRSRLQPLTPTETRLLLDGSRQEQTLLLWLGICKRYRFIRDFATEVLREKAMRLDFVLSYDDYDVFFNARAEWHREVDAVAPSTRAKLRQVVFRMLRVAGLLSAGSRIHPPILPPRLVEVIVQDDPAYLAVFPTSTPLLAGEMP
jgi:hypothetical protein